MPLRFYFKMDILNEKGGDSMQPVDYKNEYNPRESQYFQGLPKFVQEAIMQSAGSIENDEELRATAEQLIKADNGLM